MALVHLIHDALRCRLIEPFDRRHLVDVLLHPVQFGLHLVAVLQLGEVARAMERVLRERAPRIAREARRALAVDAVLRPRQIGERRQVELPQGVFELGLHARIKPLLVQRLVQLGHEPAAHHVTAGDELLAQNHAPDLIPIPGRERLHHLRAHGLGLGHGLGARHAHHLAGIVLRHHDVLTEARQREVHALDGLEEVGIHALQQLGAALFPQLAAHDAIDDRLPHRSVMLAVVVARLAIDLLRFGRELAELRLERSALGEVVAWHVLDGGICVDLRQGGVVHQVSQLALVGQLAPAARELIGRGAHVVLVGFHLRSEPVIVGQRQHVAVDVGQLPAAQELKPELEPVGQLVPADLLHVLNGDRLQAGADALGGLLRAREAGSAELQVICAALGSLHNAAAHLLLRHPDVALVPERSTPSGRGVVGQDALGHAQHLRQRSVVARAQAQQVAHRLNEIRPHRARAIRNRLQVGLRLAIRQRPCQHLVVAAEGVVCAITHVLLKLGQRCLAGVCCGEALANVLGNGIGHGHQVTRMLAGQRIRGLRAIENHSSRGGVHQFVQ